MPDPSGWSHSWRMARRYSPTACRTGLASWAAVYPGPTARVAETLISTVSGVVTVTLAPMGAVP